VDHAGTGRGTLIPGGVPLLVELLQSAGNRLLAYDAETRARLARLADKVVRLELAGLGRTLYIQVAPDQLYLHEEWSGPTHLTLRGSPLAYLRFALGPDNEGAADGAIQIEGDAVLAQQFTQVLKRVDIDWEEALSRYVGDIAAHQLGNAAREFRAWAAGTSANLQQDLADYLTEEKRILALRDRVRSFLDDVDLLRADVDRLEQRIRRLKSRR